jgi:hypothetical protein
MSDSEQSDRPISRGSNAAWALYHRWNDAFAEVAYGSGQAGLPVYLDLEDELLEKVAVSAGLGLDEPRKQLVAAVRSTLGLPTSQGGIFHWHRSRLGSWRPSGGEPPPVIALLSLLTLAAEEMREGDGFAANNYYDRLMPLLGVSGEADKNKVINSYRQCANELWDGLNGWLEALNGDRGLPTAYAFAHQYIGLPLSQALIRAHDREKLHGLFAELGLAPRSHLSAYDLDPLLADWINRNPSPASHAMKAMWKRPSARERIVEATCFLLGTWDGPRDQDVQDRLSRPGRLHVTALLRSFPAPVLELNVTGPFLGVGTEAAVDLDGGTAGESPLTLAVEDLPGRRWRLAAPGDIDPTSLLEGHLCLRSSLGLAMDRHPRRVVPLIKDDLLQAFVEAERFPLGEEGLLLCQLALAATIDRALKRVGRPGYRRWDDGLAGLPNGWAAFSGVQVLGRLQDPDPLTLKPWLDDLAVLRPLATTQLVIEGGLRLPGRVERWSSLAPPEVRVAAEGAEEIHVSVTQTRSIGADFAPIETVFREPVGILALEPLMLPDGDYEIVATVRSSQGPAKKPPRGLDMRRLRLRSADHRNLAPPIHPPLRRPLPNPAISVLSASRPAEVTEAILHGPMVHLTNPDARVEHEEFPGLGVPKWWQLRRERPGAAVTTLRARIVVPAADGASCFHTGAHHWMLPPTGPGSSKTTVEATCRRCSLVKRFPARFHASKPVSATKPNTIAAPSFDAAALPPLSGPGILPDLALDGLSHDSEGRASSMEQLALQVEPSQLFADAFLRALEVLGHVEIRRDHATLAPLDWAVVPTTLAELADGSFAVVGHRSHLLVDELTKAVDAAGGSLERTPQSPGPDRIRIVGLTQSAARDVATRTEHVVGHEIRFAVDAAHRLAAFLPRLSEVLAFLPRSPMPGGRQFRRWDNDVARWVPVGHPSAPGAYQMSAMTTAYVWRDQRDIEHGTMRRGDARLVKHLAAHDRGETLIGFDDATQGLYVPLGADLPGLYGRAAVLSSGLLPEAHPTEGALRYKQVSPTVAQHLAALLAS